MMSRNQPINWQRTVRLLAGVTLVASALHAQQGKKDEPVDPSKLAADDDTIHLTPFTVDATKDKGYYAENTLAGSRLNSNLSDLAASITVVTKQQMDDTGSLDINDVFRFEANTEGSSTYSPVVTDRNTIKDTVSGYTFGNNGGTTTNAQSNRIRGLAAPDAALNYFPASSRVPFDSYNTQSIEISRGPNSLLFGLGSPAGIVNQTATQAALNKNANTVQLRTDQYGSYRGSFGVNRSLIQDKLAVYVAGLYYNEQFARKPSYDLTRREYGALTFKPFKKTIIRGFVENYNNYANRPNFLTPRDFVTPWLQAGRPAYDPTTRTVTIMDTGMTNPKGPLVNSTLSPGFVTGDLIGANALNTTTSQQFVPGIQFDNVTRPLQRIDGGVPVDFFQRNPVLYRLVQTNPQVVSPDPTTEKWTPQTDPRFGFYDREWSSSNGLPIPPIVIGGKSYTFPANGYNYAGVTNSAIYDWKKFNINQNNFGKLHNSNYNLELEQEILPNLFFTAGWLRQDIDSVENYTVSQLTGATLTVDTNSKLINGQPNPYFGLPYVSDSTPDTFYHPETDDNYRAQLAYELDFTKNNGWVQWLGHHRFMGLWSDQVVKSRTERWRNVFESGDADAHLRYFPNLTLPLTNSNQTLWNNSSAQLQRNYYMASPGDPQATVTHSTGFYGNKGWEASYPTAIEVYNYQTGQFQKDQITERTLFSDAGSFSSYREVESYNIATQNYLFSDRIVTTLGWRRDQYWARSTGTGAILDQNGAIITPGLTPAQIYDQNTGLVSNPAYIMRRWLRWDVLSGNTKTLGVAVRPLKGLAFLDRRADEGSLVADLVRSLTVYYNKSDNFNPPPSAQSDYFGKPLAKPTGKEKDIGIGWSVLNNKLVGRISWFKTDNQNERLTGSTTFLSRLAYGDTTLMLPWARAIVRIQDGAKYMTDKLWNDNTANPVTADQQTRIAALMKLPWDYYNSIGSVNGTQQSAAKGVELQATYNPVSNWTIKLTGSKQETVYNKVAPQYDQWLAQRLPVWTSAVSPINIPDFVDANQTAVSLNNFWSGYGYDPVAKLTNAADTSSANYFSNNVTSQAALGKALEGAVALDQRKYRTSLLTNYVIPRGRLKGFALGGSERWESKAALGYFGKVGDPTQPTVINVSDVTRPVYDDGNYYTDLWISYTRKIFADKLRMKIQLNVNNVTENGGLRPIAVNYDGTPWAYRIVDSRQFLLTTTFDF